MGRPDFEDSILGDNSDTSGEGSTVGYLQESDDRTGFLTASGAPLDYRGDDLDGEE